MWMEAWHIDWIRFRFFRECIGFQSAYYKMKNEQRALTKLRGR